MPRKKLLFINACVRRATSRTDRLARVLVHDLEMRGDYEVDELVLEDLGLRPLTGKDLDARDALAARGAFDDPAFLYARMLAAADAVVAAAPYWGLAFPTQLKCFLEQADAVGLVYRYDENGAVQGLCKPAPAFYVTTRGGLDDDSHDLGYLQVAGLFAEFGMQPVRCVGASGLDLVGADVEGIMHEAEERAHRAAAEASLI